MEVQKNNIGVIRLVLASMVIISHAPEMIDGNRYREPLTRIFGTLTLGGVAVDCFFLLSGYLIAQSLSGSKSILRYLERRCLRIYPAFVVSYLLCVFVLGPMVGAHPWASLPMTFGRLVFLMDPMQYPGQLQGLHYPALNGSMWTIAYEFRCYLLMALFAVTGILARPRFMLLITAACVALSVLTTFASFEKMLDAAVTDHHGIAWIVGVPSDGIHLTSAFLVGVCFFVYRERLTPILNIRIAGIGMLLTVVLMYHNAHLADFSVAVFGAVPLFWASFKANFGPVQQINDNWDISYGTYLYGWPIAIFVLWLDRSITPWMLVGFALPLSFAFGALSWWGVEKRAKDIKRTTRALKNTVRQQ